MVNKSIHLFIDCQAALTSVFSEETPRKNIAIISEAGQILFKLGKSNIVTAHWIPGHINIDGNEIADNLAKEAAEDMIGKPETDLSRKKDKTVIIKDIRQSLQGRWQMKYSKSKVRESFQGIFPDVGVKKNIFIDRRT